MSHCHLSLNCSERIKFGFVFKKEEIPYYRGYGHRPTALGVVGKIFHLVYESRVRKKGDQKFLISMMLAHPVSFSSYFWALIKIDN